MEYVLGTFHTVEIESVNDVVTRVGHAVECFLNDGISNAMNEFN